MATLLQSRVDWDLVDEELDRVPEEFKDQGFDSLRHVLDILSAVDADAALEELKAQQETIEQLVDIVVQGYHSGFNKAIHNYSQILSRFSLAKEQINSVRSQLEEAQRRLASQSGILEIQWKKNVTTDEIVRLLRNIHSFVDMPQLILSLQDSKDWAGAVALLLDACNQITGQEYSGIGALEGIKSELRLRRNMLLKALTAELERLMYDDLEAHADLGTLGTLDSNFYSTSPHSSPRSLSAKMKRANSMRRANSFTPRVISPRVKKLKELMESAAQMGGLLELQNAMRRHSPEQIRIVVLKALTEANESSPVLLHTTDILKRDYNVDPAAAQAADRMMEIVLHTCMQVFESFVGVLRLIETVKPPPLAPGLEHLMKQANQESQGNGATGSSYARIEADAVWNCIQKEIQKLLAELLQHSSQQGNHREYQAYGGIAENKLSFSFDVQLQGVAARALLKNERSLVLWEGEELAQLVQTAMSGKQGSAYLIPHIYRVTTQFAEEGLIVLKYLEGENDSVRPNAIDKESRRSLTNFLNNFVENSFIPTIFMDFKTRCASVLEDDESFRARAKPQAVYAPGASLLPAVNMLKTSVAELLHWAILMPTFSMRLTGILESMLEKVLSAFKERVANLVADTTVQSLLADMTVSNKMGAAPSAPLAGTPVAFFTERNAESVDKFVASIMKFGFGTGGEAEDIKLLMRLMQERPIKAEHLLGSGDTYRCMNLAAIADSMDHLADIIQGKVSEAGDDLYRTASGRTQASRPKNNITNMVLTPGRKSNQASFLDGLDYMVDRFRAVAGQSLRALRLNMLLKVIRHLAILGEGRFVCDPEEVQDLDDSIGAMQRASSRIDEDIAPFLPPRKREYVFEGMAAAAARYIMWMLPEIRDINKAGVAKLSRILAVLQPFLAALGAEGGLFRPDAAHHLEKARNYCAHLTYSPATLINAAVSRPDKFSTQEWMALLEVNYHGRIVEQRHKAELQKVLQAAEKRQK